MNCHQRPGKGPVLVLVPGTWGDLQTFAPLVAELPGDLPIVVIELCWQGGHVPPSFDLSIKKLADDVLRVIKRIEEPQTVANLLQEFIRRQHVQRK